MGAKLPCGFEEEGSLADWLGQKGGTAQRKQKSRKKKPDFRHLTLNPVQNYYLSQAGRRQHKAS